MLRRSAERTMQAMVSSVFSKLHSIPSETTSASFTTQHNFSSTLSLSDSLITQPSEEGGESVIGSGLGVRMSVPDPRSGSIPAARKEGSISIEENEKVEPVLDDSSDGMFQFFNFFSKFDV